MTPEEKNERQAEACRKYRDKDREKYNAYMREWQRAHAEERKAARRMKVMLDDRAFLPERAHAYDAGLDLKSPVDIMVPAHGSAVINTGVHVALPQRTAGFLKSKSGLNVKHGITSEGVIDCGYTGAIVCKLYNNSGEDYYVSRGDKITQLVILPVRLPDFDVVDGLDDTERGAGGFGSTGK